MAKLAVRWTIGDVSGRGFEALRLSILGARRVFGPDTDYVVCVNSLPLAEARDRTGSLPNDIQWRQSDDEALPEFLRHHLDGKLAEGVAWKFAPLQIYPERHVLSLDNDCILWAMPEAVRRWLSDHDRCLLAEDVTPAFGRFAEHCGPTPLNTGIRGLPPGFDLAGALEKMLAIHPVPLTSELDEQGLQVAALSRGATPYVVRTDDVAICSPFPPHQPRLGRCGAHFVGLNMKRERPYCDSAILAKLAAHWDALRPQVEAAIG